MEFCSTVEFNRDLKKLLKKFKTLEEDLQVLRKFLVVAEHPSPPHTVAVAGLGIEHPKIIKVTSFACKALKGKGRRSGVRVIYAYFSDIEKIEFVEIYLKGNKELEDRERIRRLKYSHQELKMRSAFFKKRHFVA